MDNIESSNLENVIDRILVSAQDLRTKLQTVGQHTVDKETNGVPIMFEDSRKIKALERENKELRQALEDHQYGLELIMSKYRSHVEELIKLNKLERKVTPPTTICTKQRNNSID